MKYLFFNIAIIGACLLEVAVTANYVKRVLEGCAKLQKICEKRIDGIKLYDFQGGKLNLFSTCFANITFCGLMCFYFYSWSGKIPGLISSLTLLVYAISIFVNAGVGILVYRHADECFLTYGGIIKVNTVYGRNDCKFATQIDELKDGKKRLCLVVSNHGNVVPLKFGVMERQNDAIEIVDSYNCK